MKKSLLKNGRVICVVTALLIGMEGLAKSQVLYEDNDFSNFPTGWNVNAPSETTVAVEANVPSADKDTKKLHLTDNSKEQTVAARTEFSNVYTGGGSVTITYDFCFVNAMIDGTTGYSSGLFQLLSSTNKAAFSLNASKSAGGGASSLLVWGSGNGSANENVLLEPGSWYRVTVTAPGIGTEGKYVASISGLNGAEIHTYNAPYTPLPSFSFSVAGKVVSDYSKIEFNSGYGNAPMLDMSYTNIKVIATAEPSPACPK